MSRAMGGSRAPKTSIDARRRVLDPARTGSWFAILLGVALIAFWPTYLSRMGASTAYTHLHAATATLWIGILIVQPMAIRRRRLALHRAVGRISYGLVPLILLSVVLLAHSRITGLEGQALASQSYLLYLQLSLGGMFALIYGLAIWKRRSMDLHARLMVCTALPLVDPIAVRILLWINATPGFNPQWMTFGLTDFLIVVLIWIDRDATRGRWIFRAALPAFALSQVPALFGLTGTEAWQAFANWFAGLPLT